MFPRGSDGASARPGPDAGGVPAGTAAEGDAGVIGRNRWAATAQTLFLSRVLAVFGQTVALLLQRGAPDSAYALVALVSCVAPFVVFNMLVLVHARRHDVLGGTVVFWQIVADLAVVTYMIGVSGGPLNPWHDLFFLPLVVAAATLPAAWLWCATAVGIACFSLISFVHLPLPDDPTSAMQTLQIARWLAHSLLAVCVSYFVLHMAKSIRAREQQLAELRERETRAGCAIVLGSVAAGAAHELGTPLSTIATELGELKAAYRGDADIGRSVGVMQASVGACLQSLQNLRLSGTASLGGQPPLAADALVEQIVARFHTMRPGAHVELHVDAAGPAPHVLPDLGLQQAIVNLLSNAAHVSPQSVRAVLSWDERDLRVQVIDQGPGLPPDIAGRLGSALYSSKPPAEGRGVGLFLTQMTANRLGGELVLKNAPTGGAVAEISVPLESLKEKGRADG